MPSIKKSLILTMTIVMLSGWTVSASAADNVFREIFQDAFYGGLAGGLIGTATMAFAHKPSDHLRNVGYVAAGGVFAGSAYGLVRSTRALAETDNGSVKFAMPTIMPDFKENPSKGQTTLVINAELLRGTF